MKLYVVEWDRYSLHSIHYTRESAEEYGKKYMHSILEYEVQGEIVNDEVFVIVDESWDWKGIHSSKEGAIFQKALYSNDWFVENVKIVGGKNEK